MTIVVLHTTITTILARNGKIITKSKSLSDIVLSEVNTKERLFPQFLAAAQEFAKKHHFVIFARGEIIGGYIWLCDFIYEIDEE